MRSQISCDICPLVRQGWPGTQRCCLEEAVVSGEVQQGAPYPSGEKPNSAQLAEAQLRLSLWKPEFTVPCDCHFQDTAGVSEAPDCVTGLTQAPEVRSSDNHEASVENASYLIL